ncbi:MAG: ATP-binding protein [Bacteroidota bacterium]
MSTMFPRLSIRNKLIIAFVGLSILPLLFIGIYGIYSNVNTLKNVALENLVHDVHTIRGQAGNFLLNVESDLLVFNHEYSTERFIDKLEAGDRKPPETETREVATELLKFASMKGIYYQISIINLSKDEMIRIQCDDITDSSKHCRIVPRDELRQAYGSLYFLLTQNLAADQIIFSPAEMVYQHTKQLPVVNFIMPLTGKTKRIGILVASVFAGNLFKVMETQRNLGSDEKVVLVGTDGYYLYHSDLKNDWDALIATRSEANLLKAYPPSVARQILSGKEGIVSEGIDDIIAYAPLFPAHPGLITTPQAIALPESFVLFESVPSRNILNSARTFGWTFAGFLMIFLIAAILLGLLATQQFTYPIAEVARSAEIISQGNYAHRLDVRTGDEIEKLASQFNAMAASLERHEREIAEHRLRLEEMVANRTKELVAEKSKLRAIIDNVPSAFILLNKQFKIETVSEAFSAITNFVLSDVRGKSYQEIFSGGGFCSKSGYEQIITTRKIESHIDRTYDKTGAEQYIEHITIPIIEGSDISAILMIITDITQRKRLEEQLIQTEKLMATGEMSAIIAHEFRNALTSIKMILQLQHEATAPSSEDRKSLAVALDSIDHMETIVRELLNFARPSPMDFQTEDINAIVDDCLKFAQLRIHKQQIHLTKEISTLLPPIPIDAPRVKESIINLLLNAIQAIESSAIPHRNHEICVYAKGMILPKTLHDFAPPQIREGRNGIEQREGQEIILRKGKECLVIGVRDTGPGIDRDLLQRIFDPFYTTKTNGTGLGLPMVKRTVNAHNGVVVVKSSPEKGTSFEIVLPLLNSTQSDA